MFFGNHKVVNLKTHTVYPQVSFEDGKVVARLYDAKGACVYENREQVSPQKARKHLQKAAKPYKREG
jgi:hypothetical protein